MSVSATDTRIVQMQFDNRDFERDIAKSEKSLTKFKKLLNFEDCEESLEEFSKATKHMTFDSMAENLQRLTDKFTGLGTVSEYIISRIRHGLENAASSAKRFVDSMTIEQLNAGMEKFGQLNKNVQTIMAATGRSEEDVYTVMERLNKYTDQTSYNFTDMASNIGKFTSVGVPLEAAEKQMEGIANWAARSGGGIQEASRAMYNLSQAMGVGAMTKIDWKSIENAGMATKEYKEQLIAAGVEAGTLVAKVDASGKTIYKTSQKLGKQVEVNYKNVAETLSKKWANTEVMQKSFMAYYYDDLYYEAVDTAMAVTDEQKKILEDAFKDDAVLSKKDWKSLEGQKLATQAVKEAAIEAAVAQGNLVKETTKDGKTIYKTAEKYGKQIEVTLDHFEESLSTGWLDKGIAKNVWAFDNLAKSAYESAQKCMTFTDVINAWKDQISTGWMNSWRKVFGDLSDSMELFSNICNKVADALQSLIDFRNEVLDAWESGGGRDSLWAAIVGEVVDEGEVLAYEGAYGFIDVMIDIGKMLRDGFIEMLKIFMTGEERIWVEDDPEFLSVWLGTKIANVFKNLQEFTMRVKAFFEASSKGSDKSRWEQIQDVINAIYATFVLAYTMFRDITNFAFQLFDEDHLGASVDAILTLMSDLGLAVTDVSRKSYEGKGLKVLFDMLLETVKPLTTAINHLVGAFTGVIAKVLHLGEEGDGTITFWQVLAGVINKVFGVVTSIGAPIIEFFASFTQVVGELFQNGITPETLTKAGTTLKASLKTMLDGVFSFIPDFSGKIKKLYDSVLTWYKNGFKETDWENVKTMLKGLAHNILGSLPEGIQTGLTNTYNRVKQLLSGIWGTISGFFSNAVNVFKKRFDSKSLEKLKKDMKGSWAKVAGAIPEGIRGSIKKAFNQVSAYVKELWNKITGFFDKQFGSSSAKTEGMHNKVKAYVTSFVTGTDGGDIKPEGKTIFDRAIDWFKDTFGNLKAAFQKMLGNAEGDSAAFKTSFMKIIEWLKGLDWSTILTYLIGIAGVSLIARIIAKAIKAVRIVAKGLTTISEAITEGIAGLHKSEKVETFGDKMLKFAGAIGIITACIAVIGNMKTDAVKQGGIVVGAIILALVGLAAVLNQVYKKTDVSTARAMMLSLISIALSVSIMSSALLRLAKIQPDQLTTVIWGLTAIIAALGAVSIAAEKGDLSFKSLSGAVALCAGIWLLVTSLLKVKNLKPDQLLKMGGTLTGILGLLLAFAVGLKKFGGSMADSGMKEATYLAAAVGILLFSLVSVARVPFGQLIKALAATGVILKMLQMFVKSINNNKIVMKDRGMSSALAVAASITLLMLSLVPVAKLPFGKVLQALLALGAIMTAMYLFIQMINKNNATMKGTGMAQLVILAGSIVVLMLALIPLALLPFMKLLGAVAAVSIIIGVLGAFVKKINSENMTMKGTGMIQLLALAAAMVAVVLALTPLALMNPQQIIVMLSSFIVIMGMFALVVKASKQLNMKSTGPALLMMVGLAGIMYAFALALEKIPRNLDWKVILAFSTGLAAMLVGIAAASDIFQHVGITGVMILAAGVAAILLVIASLAPLVLGRIGTGLQQMAANMALAGSMFADFIASTSGFSEGDVESTKAKFNAIYNLIKGLHGVGGYVTDVHKFSECLLLLGSGLSQFEFSTQGIENPDSSNGVRLLEKLLSLKDQIATYTGGRNAANNIILLGAGLQNFTTATADIGGDKPASLSMLNQLLNYGNRLGSLKGAFAASAQMSFLGAGLSNFNTSSGGITEDNPKALQLLGNISDNADNLSTLSTLDLTGFSDTMAALGGAMSIYALGVKEAEGLELNEMPDVSGAIAVLQSLSTGFSNDIGEFVIPELPEEGELTNFGVQLAALAGGLIKFADASKGFGEGTDKALEVLEFLGKLKTNLTQSNLEVTKIFGQNSVTTLSLTAFGIEISALGNSMQNYSNALKNFKGNDKALDAINYFYKLQTRLQQGSIDLETFNIANESELTDTFLTDFGNQISALGTSMKNYSDSVADFKNNTDALNAIDFFWKLQEKLTGHSIVTEIFSIFTGATPETLSTFGTDISALGDALAKFAASVTFDEGVEADFTNALASLDILSKLAQEMPVYGGIKSLWEGSARTLSELGGDITTLGTAMGQFSDALSAVGQQSGKKYDSAVVREALADAKSVADIIVTFASLAGDEIFSVDAFAVFQRLNDLILYMGPAGKQEGYDFVKNLVDFMSAFQEAADAAGGITDSTIFTAFANLAKGIESMAKASPDFNFAPIGLSMSEGLTEGIKSGRAGVVQAMVDTAIEAYNAAKAALDSNSPSKLFMKLGGYVSEGFAIGITDEDRTVAQSGTSMVQTVVDATNRILAQLDSLLAGEMDLEPTIRPVLDLSNVQAGAGMINGLLGQNYGSYGLTPAYSQQQAQAVAATAMTTTNYGMMSQAMTEMKDALMSYVDARQSELISSLSEQNQILGDRLNNLSIYLDTGALVGGVSSGVDKDIGRSTFYKRRNN